jgi:hypothetical protein
MFEEVPNRNWPAFYSTLLELGHAHLEPSEMARCFEAESRTGGEMFYSDGVFDIINFGGEGSVVQDVELALEAWIEEIVQVALSDFQYGEEFAGTIRMKDGDALVARLVESLALPYIDSLADNTTSGS